ncbi:MAG TPA: hypothetical protein VGB73_06800 [Pyrinomonadaceae bacterium]|jgi:hypothetical protein
MPSPTLSLRRALLRGALALTFLLLLNAPGSAVAARAQKLKVDVDVTVHNSDIGVSQETLDDMVEKLLEEAGFQVEEAQADSASIQLKIDIYRQSNGKFKIVGDLDDSKDDNEDEDEHEEEETDAQDKIDDIVTTIVNDFIKLLRKS